MDEEGWGRDTSLDYIIITITCIPCIFRTLIKQLNTIENNCIIFPWQRWFFSYKAIHNRTSATEVSDFGKNNAKTRSCRGSVTLDNVEKSTEMFQVFNKSYQRLFKYIHENTDVDNPSSCYKYNCTCCTSRLQVGHHVYKLYITSTSGTSRLQAVHHVYKLV